MRSQALIVPFAVLKLSAEEVQGLELQERVSDKETLLLTAVCSATSVNELRELFSFLSPVLPKLHTRLTLHH